MNLKKAVRVVTSLMALSALVISAIAVGAGADTSAGQNSTPLTGDALADSLGLKSFPFAKGDTATMTSDGLAVNGVQVADCKPANPTDEVVLVEAGGEVAYCLTGPSARDVWITAKSLQGSIPTEEEVSVHDAAVASMADQGPTG